MTPSSTFTSQIRDKLLALQQTLLTRHQDAQKTISHRSYEVGDVADTGAQEEQNQTYLHLQHADDHTLRLVEHSLQLLENGEYGQCQECEDPIPEKRLLTHPTAQLCVECQQDQEDAAPRKARPGLLDDAF